MVGILFFEKNEKPNLLENLINALNEKAVFDIWFISYYKIESSKD